MNTEYWTRQVQQLHNDGQDDLADDVTALIDAGKQLFTALCRLNMHHRNVHHPDGEMPEVLDVAEATTAWLAVLQKR